MAAAGRENLHAHARSCHGIFCIPLKFEWEVAVNKARLTEPQYLATISMVCQKLETVEVNWKMFDLRLIRKNLGASHVPTVEVG